MIDIQERMFAEMQNKEIFKNALKFGEEYLNHINKRNIYPTTEALINLIFFDEDFPVESNESLSIINQLNNYGSPATVYQIGGRYFGFVNGGVVPVGLAAKILATFWDQNTAMDIMSPLASKLECVVEKWLKTIFGLPAETVAGFVSGTSSANLCGLAAARHRLLKNQGWEINQKGMSNAPPIKILLSKEAHTTVIKALAILGFGKDQLTFIECDDQGRINSEMLPELNNNTLLILSAGNVNTGAFDRFSAIMNHAKGTGAWIHIDGAFGLWAAAVKNLSHLTSGIHEADSWAVDGHKTLNTPYDCGIVMCKDKEALKNALNMTGEYLIVSNTRDGMLYTPEMSRRARIVELWATLKYLGQRGINQMIYGLHERAKQFASGLSQINGFSVLNDIVFNQILVCCESDDITGLVIKQIQEERICWVGESRWKGRKVIRISVCSWATTPNDVELALTSFKSSLTKVQESLA